MEGAPMITIWWNCCRDGCRREVNMDIWGSTCPDCSHTRCGYCERMDAPGSGYDSWVPDSSNRNGSCCGRPNCMGNCSVCNEDAEAASMSETKDTALHARAEKRILPMLLNSTLVDHVCADSGSDVNCITEAFAKKIGARISGANTVHWFSLPIKEKRFPSIGTISIRCKFPDELSTIPSVSFFVFKKLICDVIIGRKFLRATQTLDLYQYRLKVEDTRRLGNPAIRSVGAVGEQIKCWIDGNAFWSFPDTGADLNLISTGFAKRLGYGTHYGDKDINLADRHFVDFADCSSSRTEGSVQLVVSFCPPVECHPSPHKLVETSKLGARDLGIGVVGVKRSIVEPFHVIGDLGFDIILGETLLASVAAYTQHRSNFALGGTPEVSTMAICKKRCRKEGKTITGPPITPKQRFHDDFSIESDRYNREQEEIEDKRNRGLLTAMQDNVMQNQNNQRHIQWCRERQDLFELYDLNYLEKIAPQEIA